MDDLYREIILDHYKNPKNYGKLNKSSSSFKKNNPLCGDEIGIDLKISSKKIQDIKFYGEGCAISIASASLLTEFVKGKNIDKIKRMGKDDVLKLLNVQLTPTRLKCAILPLEVLQKAISMYTMSL